MKTKENAHARAVQAAHSYLATRPTDMARPAPLVIGRDVPVCPPLALPAWHDMHGFTSTPQRFIQTA